MNHEQIRFALVNAVTTYDRQQSTRKHYNRYALGQYLSRVNDIMEDIENGADPAQAIAAGFTETLQKRCLKACKLEAPAPRRSLSWGYMPVSQR